MTQGILPDSPMTEMPTTQIFNSRINGDKDDIYANDTPQVDYSQDNGDVPY